MGQGLSKSLKMGLNYLLQFVVAESFSSVQLFATLWIPAHRASLASTIPLSLLKLMSSESVMPSNHLILLSPSPLALNLSQHHNLFQWVSSSHQVAKVLELQLQNSPSCEYSGLISFRNDWFDFLAFQGTLKSLLQHHNSKASVLGRSAFFMVQLSHMCKTTGKTIALTSQNLVI